MGKRNALQRLRVRHQTGLLLAIVLMLAAGLRFTNVGHDADLSRPYSVDARTKFYRARDLAAGGEIQTNPETRYKLYRQPLFLVRSYGLIWRALDAVGLAGDDGRMRVGFNAYMIVLSLATVVLVYRLARTVFDEPGGALLAALLFAVFPVNVAGSLYVKEDIPLMFWFVAATAALCALARTRRPAYYLWTGLWIGLAVSAKYTGLLLLPLLALAHLLVVFQSPGKDRIRRFFAWQAFAAVALAALAFLAVNPHVLTEWPDFWKGFTYQATYASGGHHDGTVIRGVDYWWTFYLRYAIVPGITLPVTLFFLAGLVWAIVRRNRPAILIAVAVLLAYLSVETSPAKPFPFFARYLHYAYPLMAVLAAYGFCQLWRLLGQRRLARAVGIVLGLVLVFTPLVKSVILAAGTRPDTRVLASRWIEENLTPGSRIYAGSFSYHPQHFDAERFPVTFDGGIQWASAEDIRQEGAQYLVVSSFQYERYRFSLNASEAAREAWETYRSFEREFELVKVFRPRFSFQSYGQHNPEIRIYRVS